MRNIAVVLACFILIAGAPGERPANVWNVRSLGAVGDGKHTDTASFQKALDECSAAGGGVVLVPAGNYLIGSVVLKSNTTLRLEKDAVLQGSRDITEYPIVDIRWEGRTAPGHRALITAVDATHIAIEGPGHITGAAALGNLRNPRGPVLIELVHCTDARLHDFSTRFSRLWSIHPVFCQNVTAEGLTIRSTGGNGDGIDIDSSRHVAVNDCDIDTGDDCVAIKSGRGLTAYKLAEPSEDISVTHCTLGDSIFACVGVGSEASGGVSHVRIEDCKFTHAGTYSIYIKSHIGRGAGIADVHGKNLQVLSATGGFLRFNLISSGRTDSGDQAVAGMDGIPFGRDFSFSDCAVNCGRLVSATETSPKKPVDGLVLTNITGTCQKGMQLANIAHAELSGIHVSGFSGALLETSNATGRGLDGAAPYVAPTRTPR